MYHGWVQRLRGKKLGPADADFRILPLSMTHMNRVALVC